MLTSRKTEYLVLERRLLLQTYGLVFVVGFIVGMVAMLMIFGVLS